MPSLGRDNSVYTFVLQVDQLESFAEKGPECLDGYQTEYEPAVQHCSKNFNVPGLYCEKRYQQVKVGDSFPLSFGEVHLECWVQFWASHY